MTLPVDLISMVFLLIAIAEYESNRRYVCMDERQLQTKKELTNTYIIIMKDL